MSNLKKEVIEEIKERKKKQKGLVSWIAIHKNTINHILKLLKKGKNEE